MKTWEEIQKVATWKSHIETARELCEQIIDGFDKLERLTGLPNEEILIYLNHWDDFPKAIVDRMELLRHDAEAQ